MLPSEALVNTECSLAKAMPCKAPAGLEFATSVSPTVQSWKMGMKLNVRVRREPKASSEQVGLLVRGGTKHKDDIVKALTTRIPGWVKLHPDM